jgi:hypothetical protein
VRALGGSQPIHQQQQRLRRRLKGTDILVPLPIAQDTHTGDDDLLMHIQAATALVHQFHVFPPSNRFCGRPTGCFVLKILFYVLG